MGYNKEEINSLLVQKLSGYISVEDDAYVERAINEDEEVRALWSAMLEKHAAKGENFLNSLNEEVAWNKLRGNIERSSRRNVRAFNYKKWISIAAIFISIVAISYYFLSSYLFEEKTPSLSLSQEKSTIELKLADGRSIPLTDNGFVDVGAAKLNMVDGKLIYQSDHSALNWNTLSVPFKMDFKLILSDGTEVWMNSASHLRFPFNFNGETREVYLEGEAYFKVAKDVEKPFIVHAKGADIEVLGTSFNVSSYGEEVITSLVEGSVVNKAGDQSIVLEAGYQSVFTPSAGFRKEKFEADHALSWIDGIYYFEDIPLVSIRDVIWRWFKVELIIDDPRLHQLTFTGAIERDKSLNLFMQHLELTSGIKAVLKEDKLHLK